MSEEYFWAGLCGYFAGKIVETLIFAWKEFRRV